MTVKLHLSRSRRYRSRKTSEVRLKLIFRLSLNTLTAKRSPVELKSQWRKILSYLDVVAGSLCVVAEDVPIARVGDNPRLLSSNRPLMYTNSLQSKHSRSLLAWCFRPSLTRILGPYPDGTDPAR
jgi:hypothetical protein